jgi:hypothetical protein
LPHPLPATLGSSSVTTPLSAAQRMSLEGMGASLAVEVRPQGRSSRLT